MLRFLNRLYQLGVFTSKLALSKCRLKTVGTSGFPTAMNFAKVAIGGGLMLTILSSEVMSDDSETTWTESLKKKYLDRVRMFSHPAKVFECYATMVNLINF